MGTESRPGHDDQCVDGDRIQRGLQASLSTLICMIPLFFVPVYIIVAFAKTVCLVAIFGLLHGIVIIPVCLSFFPKKTRPMVARTPAILEEQKESMLT
ncbi:hypothetical protein TELCIR_01080 [Teladorsagia circumcincta]|uniref:Uncharacterized protein n=1 Tax=Teladorsagia circumcincta TaxID=45464 RepID=A0A2G9V2W5_TELCI|nr:hypothetical protein TELCIR_01080 [Teladorsagia circumcincta]